MQLLHATSKRANEQLKLDVSKTEILIFPINQFFLSPRFPYFYKQHNRTPSFSSRKSSAHSSSLQPLSVLSNLPTQYRNIATQCSTPMQSTIISICVIACQQPSSTLATLQSLLQKTADHSTSLVTPPLASRFT